MTHADRVFLRLVGWPCQRRLLPAYAALLIGVGLADPMIDWLYLKAQLRAQDTLVCALQITALASVWSLTCGAALAPTWRAASARYLLRQPLDTLARSRLLVPSLLPAMVPIGLVWWLMPLDSTLTLIALSVASLAMSFGVSTGTPGGLMTGLVSALATAAIAWAALRQWPAHGLLSLSAAALVPTACTQLRAHTAPAMAQRSRGLRAPKPWLAVLRRDLLCLTRSASGTLRQLLLLAGLAGAFLWALQVNGGFEGRGLFRAACVLQLLALLPLYDILVRLRHTLGSEFTRRHWPISQRRRALSLLGLCAVIAAPSSLTLLLTGMAMGGGWLPLLVTYTAVQLLAVSALFAHYGRQASTAHGWSLWTWLVHAILACVLPPIAYLALALLSAPFAFAVLERGLERLAGDAAQARLGAHCA